MLIAAPARASALTLLHLAAMLLFCMATEGRAAAAWELVAADAHEIVIDVAVPAPELQAVANGARLRVSGFSDLQVAGGVLWPALELPVALPPEGDVTVRAEISGRRILPGTVADLVKARAGAEPRGDAQQLPGWQAADRDGHVHYRAPGWAAGLRRLSLMIQPVRADADGRLWAPRELRIRLSLSGAGPDILPPGTAASPFRKLHERIVANPRQVGGWMRPPRPFARPRPGDSFATATSPWLRIEIARRGVYVLTAEDLLAAGITPETVDLSQLRLFCGDAGALPESLTVMQLPTWMEPCALHVVGDAGGTWGAATRVYFLGNGPDGWRDHLDLPALAEDPYYVHPAANRFTYWLCWGGDFSSEPLRMEERSAAPGGLEILDAARARVHLEENDKFDLRPREESLPWERFFYTDLRASASGGASLILDLPGLVPGSQAVGRASLWGKNWRTDLYPDHQARLELNGRFLDEVQWENVGRALPKGQSALAGEQNTLRITVPERHNSGGDLLSDQIYLAWVEVDYQRRLSAVDDSLAFVARRADIADRGLRISGLSRADGWLLLAAGDFRRPVVLDARIEEADGEFTAAFRVDDPDTLESFVLLQSSDAASPERISTPQRSAALRERTAPVDYIVVAPGEFDAAATALAEHRRQVFWGAAGDSAVAGRVAVVDIAEIFDEFAWGQHDPTALRNFVVYAHGYWKGDASFPTLSHLVLLGDACYDYRGYVEVVARDLVPSYIHYDWPYQIQPLWKPSYLIDDWFVRLDGPGDELPDLAIGRLPVGSADEAGAMVAKAIAYDLDAPQGEWRTRLLLAADDVCQSYERDGIGFDHMEHTELLSAEWAPSDAPQEKLYLYEYGRECIYDRKPKAQADLMDRLAAGVILFNYIGHGSEVQLADEKLLEISNMSSVQNDGLPFLMITASCAVGKFAHGGDGLALAAMRRAAGGAIGVISASATAASSANFHLNSAILGNLFPEGTIRRPVAFGPALLGAKLRTEHTSTRNDRRYNLLGDPASRFPSPAGEIELSFGAAAGDTLLRGTTAHLSGVLRDAAGALLTDFNGTALITVRDSDIAREPVPDNPGKDYFLPGARIFSGSTAVSGGSFSASFVVPTALRTGPRGPARVYAYAMAADGSARDAAGALTDIFIPESTAAITDTRGPDIELTWLDGDDLAAGSRLQASLRDSSGIYVAALSPSRAVVVTISDAVDRILVAEDISAAVTFPADSPDAFMEASVVYALPAGLPTGQELRLTFQASDNVNQRSSSELYFTLSGEGSVSTRVLSGAYTMPNPMEAATHFVILIEREADLLVSIFSAAGRQVRRLEAAGMAPDRARTQGLAWDGRDADGDRVANGLYFYQVEARAPNRPVERLIERLIVMR